MCPLSHTSFADGSLTGRLSESVDVWLNEDEVVASLPVRMCVCGSGDTRVFWVKMTRKKASAPTRTISRRVGGWTMVGEYQLGVALWHLAND
jgi:hypothetical protein